MYLAIPRDGKLFDKETADQINVRLNAIDSNTTFSQDAKTREYYYDNVNLINLKWIAPMVNNASLEYGKVIVLNFTFKVSGDKIAKIPSWEEPFDIYCNVCDKEGNIAVVSIDKKGLVQFATKPELYGDISLYCVIVKS